MPRTLSTFLACRARADLPLAVPHSARVPRQLVRRGESGFVRHRELRRELSRRTAPVVDVTASEARLEVRPLDALRDARGRSVLFLLPSDALGDAVMYAGAIREVATGYGLGRIAVGFTGKASDVFAHLGRPCDLYPLFLPRCVLRQYELVIDFEADLPALHRVAENLVTIDRLVLDRVGLPSSYRWQPARAPRPIRRIGLFSLSSTPLRTLPPALTAFLGEALAARGHQVELVLDTRQRQGALYAEALAAGTAGTLRTDLASVEALLRLMTELDYGIFCDSGPAHLAKMRALPGFGIYTTVAAGTVQGHFRNLAAWQAPYQGTYCRAPCGLVGVMVRRDRTAYGCMDSLSTERAELVRPAVLPPPETRRFLLERPVGCVASLIADRETILDRILADIAARAIPAAGSAS